MNTVIPPHELDVETQVEGECLGMNLGSLVTFSFLWTKDFSSLGSILNSNRCNHCTDDENLKDIDENDGSVDYNRPLHWGQVHLVVVLWQTN